MNEASTPYDDDATQRIVRHHTQGDGFTAELVSAPGSAGHWLALPGGGFVNLSLAHAVSVTRPYSSNLPELAPQILVSYEDSFVEYQESDALSILAEIERLTR